MRQIVFSPIGSEATKVKQEEKTVEDAEFYKKFFEAMEKETRALGGELR
ncbi:hypothetical protein [Candidatus Hakubella thermalkaliphila]|uniref:Uncharacterized protein n=1 Tax=Candidatus Hakubella thermalkaliphila TaxID=2754717 RepID=A0A6V8P2D7_9ACTN|nr:hypothetical protein [Candidatus Hakubella thermalkaliphila]GFP25980.1 hypothetical protein HKBW3S25_01466 [Candidatus Hakubella thermalkaliphila]GFP28410.1 hypothetical protein HKBW3S33_01825 [Candidatus Hakubella thermalkaliphila]